MEGTPVQELSCIAMNYETQNVIRVYHNFAYCPKYLDKWARRHIHGLDTSVFSSIAFENEDALCKDFKEWTSSFSNIVEMYANCPRKENTLLGLDIKDIGLPVWSERVKHKYHNVPNMLKERNESFFMGFDECCHSMYHRLYRPSYKVFLHTPCQIAKWQSGYHCSLADSFELFLYYCENFNKL